MFCACSRPYIHIPTTIYHSILLSSVGASTSLQLILNIRLLLKMPVAIWNLLMLGFAIHPRQIRAEDENICTAHNEWTVFRERKCGDVDFERVWDDYVKGFGKSEKDFWLGLDDLYEKTKEGNMKLETNLAERDTGAHMWAKYRTSGIAVLVNWIYNNSGLCWMNS